MVLRSKRRIDACLRGRDWEDKGCLVLKTPHRSTVRPAPQTHLGDLPFVEKSLQDFVVFYEVVLELGVVVDLFHLHLALLAATPQSVAQDTGRARSHGEPGEARARALESPSAYSLPPAEGDQEHTAPQAGSMQGRSGRVEIDAAEGGGTHGAAPGRGRP